METLEVTMTTKPFHDTIVSAIRRCNPSPSNPEIHQLLGFIKTTTIPKNHDQIIAEIDKFFDFPGSAKWALDIREVKESLLRQKRENEEKADGEKEDINLDDLQQEAEKIVVLLKNRRPGIRRWNSLMHNQLQKLHKLISKAIGD